MRRQLATAAVLVLLLSGCGLSLSRDGQIGTGNDDRRTVAPVLREMGLAFAKSRAQAAGGFEVEDHDAAGRARRSLDDRDWQVCFQLPAGPPLDARTYPAGTVVRVGVVRSFERCPSADRGRPRQVRELDDLVGRTAHMARQDLGEDASIEFVKQITHREINWDLGAWRVCKVRSLNSSDRTWHGQPLHAAVVELGKKCWRPR